MRRRQRHRDRPVHERLHAWPNCGDGIARPASSATTATPIRPTCARPAASAFCGDGYAQAEVEECDDGNSDNTDGCLPTFCTLATCGDGFVQAGVETCDDGNDDDTDMCPTSCEPASCGDGFVYAGMEECDDGNNDPDDGCSPTCEYDCNGGMILDDDFNGVTYWKVQVMGTMSDPNIFAACEMCGLETPCQATAGCNYNDGMCYQTNNENSCGNPMQGLAQHLGCGSPANCAQLNGVYQYMGNNWVGGCGVENGSWCAQGNNFQNKFALCVAP
ncbi:MAG: DUF4215 domain-containing protein [Deltaproteobacteria bacterium]|nr:DUF4215 domain-containing protein [Deltaproteobacteria bacterium]